MSMNHLDIQAYDAVQNGERSVQAWAVYDSLKRRETFQREAPKWLGWIVAFVLLISYAIGTRIEFDNNQLIHDYYSQQENN